MLVCFEFFYFCLIMTMYSVWFDSDFVLSLIVFRGNVGWFKIDFGSEKFDVD